MTATFVPYKIELPVGGAKLLLDGLNKPVWPTSLSDLNRAGEIMDMLEKFEAEPDNDKTVGLELNAKQLEAARKCVRFWLSKGGYAPRSYGHRVATAFIDEGS